NGLKPLARLVSNELLPRSTSVRRCLSAWVSAATPATPTPKSAHSPPVQCAGAVKTLRASMTSSFQTGIPALTPSATSVASVAFAAGGEAALPACGDDAAVLAVPDSAVLP